jgi:hypothetical protein
VIFNVRQWASPISCAGCPLRNDILIVICAHHVHAGREGCTSARWFWPNPIRAIGKPAMVFKAEVGEPAAPKEALINAAALFAAKNSVLLQPSSSLSMRKRCCEAKKVGTWSKPVANFTSSLLYNISETLAAQAGIFPWATATHTFQRLADVGCMVSPDHTVGFVLCTNSSQSWGHSLEYAEHIIVIAKNITPKLKALKGCLSGGKEEEKVGQMSCTINLQASKEHFSPQERMCLFLNIMLQTGGNHF